MAAAAAKCFVRILLFAQLLDFAAAGFQQPGALTRVRSHASARACTSMSVSSLLQKLKWPLSLISGSQKSSKRYVCGKNRYGCDPRGPEVDEPVVSQAAAVIREDVLGETFPPATAGEVGELVGGVAHLRQLLENAGDRAVILKFKREGCLACKATVEPLASAAQAYAGRADFIEVDYGHSKAFCRQCAISVVPCAHIYTNGELNQTMPLGPRAWAAFATYLEETVGEPAAEVLAPEIKSPSEGANINDISEF